MVLSKKHEFSCCFSSTLKGKNNSLRVERHELLLRISKKQAKSKDHNYNIDGKPTQLLNRVGSILLNNDDGQKTHSIIKCN